MSFENPLEKIRAMNTENQQKKAQEEALKKEQDLQEQKNIEALNMQKEAEEEKKQALERGQETQHQENIDDQYELLGKQKEDYLEELAQLKERISEITGTQDEMVAQYHKAINEAKMDSETLKYVRDNFGQIFKDSKEQWKQAGSAKRENIESKSDSEKSVAALDSQLKDLHPKTTEGKEIITKQTEEDFAHDFLKNIGSALAISDPDYLRDLRSETLASSFMEKNKMSEDEFEVFKTQQVQKIINEFVDKNYGGITFDDEGKQIEYKRHESRGTSFILSEIKTRLEYQVNIPKEQSDVDDKFNDEYIPEYREAQKLAQLEYKKAPAEVRRLISNYGYGHFGEFADRFTPESIKELLGYRDPKSLGDFMDSFSDMKDLYIGAIKFLTKNFEENNEKFSDEGFEEYLKSSPVYEKSYSQRVDFPYISEMGCENTLKNLKSKYSAAELLEKVVNEESKNEQKKEDLLNLMLK